MADTDQRAIVQELYKRIDSLPPEKQASVRELAKRFGIGGTTAGTGKTGARLKGEPSGGSPLLPMATATMLGGPILGEAAGLIPAGLASRLRVPIKVGPSEFGPPMNWRGKTLTNQPDVPISPLRRLQLQGILKPPPTTSKWQGGPSAVPNQPPEFSSIPQTQTPSGRVPGTGIPKQYIPPAPNEVRQAAAAAREKLGSMNQPPQPAANPIPPPPGYVRRTPLPQPSPTSFARDPIWEDMPASTPKELPKVEPIKPPGGVHPRRVPPDQVPPPVETPGSKALPPPKGETESTDIYMKQYPNDTTIRNAAIAKDANLGRYLKAKGMKKSQFDELAQDEGKWKPLLKEAGKTLNTDYRFTSNFKDRLGEIRKMLPD